MLHSLSSIPNLTKFDVAITGDWSTATGQREWNGEAIAELPLVGIIFLVCGSRCYWAKSNTPSVYAADAVSNKLALRLYLHATRDLNVQFMYWVGNGVGIYEAEATLSSKEYMPVIAQSRTVQSGELVSFATFEATPVTTLYAMFLAKQDVKTKRKHIWALRKPLLDHLASPSREVFAFGRHGQIAI